MPCLINISYNFTLQTTCFSSFPLPPSCSVNLLVFMSRAHDFTKSANHDVNRCESWHCKLMGPLSHTFLVVVLWSKFLVFELSFIANVLLVCFKEFKEFKEFWNLFVSQILLLDLKGFITLFYHSWILASFSVKGYFTWMTNSLFLVEIFELTDPNLAYLLKSELMKIIKKSHKSMWL